MLFTIPTQSPTQNKKKFKKDGTLLELVSK